MVWRLHLAFQFGIAFCGPFGCRFEHICGPRDCCQWKVGSSPADALFAVGTRNGLRLPGFDGCANAVGDSDAILVVCFDQSGARIGGFDDARRFARKTEICIG